MNKEILNLWGSYSALGAQMTIFKGNSYIARPVAFAFGVKEGGYFFVYTNYRDPKGPGVPDTGGFNGEITKHDNKVYSYQEGDKEYNFTEPTSEEIITNLETFKKDLEAEGLELEQEREKLRLAFSIPGERSLV